MTEPNLSENTVWSSYWDMINTDLDNKESFPHVTPLLAHYTSLQNLENILSNNEMWLSNPLFMNDLEEVRFGVTNGFEIIQNHKGIRGAFDSDQMASNFFKFLELEYNAFTIEDVFDLYVMCFSRHDQSDENGRLSMWRGYGNNGNGVALVFDTSKITVLGDSPLVISRVEYATSVERIGWIQGKADEVATFISDHSIDESLLYGMAKELISRIVLFSIFTKHKGFEEENEWRLVYLKDRDVDNKLDSMFGYFNGPRGIEPKLKLKLEPMAGTIGENFQFSDIIHSIILGPTTSSPLALMSIERMLKSLRKDELIERLKSSTIPFRG